LTTDTKTQALGRSETEKSTSLGDCPMHHEPDLTGDGAMGGRFFRELQPGFIPP
jgi:hypothetical protein